MRNPFSHFDEAGQAVMVDVSAKASTSRVAVAQGEIQVCPEIMEAILAGGSAKGDVLGVARIAGIMACKRTWESIPLCHPLPISKCSLDFETQRQAGVIRAVCQVKTESKTGVEMEALHGVSVALLTVYDMCKAIDKRMVLRNIHLISKSGGKSGNFTFEGEDDA
ncbi:MAG: cyclic pyranopterin monophosphate synthase MoaC [Firmicutes bacterium]|nr:cyclic pyranopterin monophosphate synthase MoaC [Bacillota bacterium]